MKTLTINTQAIKLQLLDTARQEKYRNMVSVSRCRGQLVLCNYYRGVNVALIVFD